MKVIILAAGYATRLYPLTENQPKPLLLVQGKPILDYILDDVQTILGINEILIVSNHKFISHFKKWKTQYRSKLPIRLFDDGTMTNESRLGAINDLATAVAKFKINEDVMVLAGDNLYDFSLNGFVDFFRQNQKDLIMVHEETDISKLQKTGVAELRGNQILSFEEKPKQPKSTFAVPPFYIYKKETLPLFADYIYMGFPSDAPGNFIAWLCRQNEVLGYRMSGHRFDIGDLVSYQFAQNICVTDLLKRR